VEDLVRIGAYAAGSDPTVDWALKHLPAIQTYLRQGVEERADFGDTVERLETMWQSGATRGGK